METIEQIRQHNLRCLVVEHGGVTNLALLTGKSSSQLSQWLNASPDSRTGRPRAISSDSAREIEAKAKKAHGWMDRSNHTDAQMHIGKVIEALASAAALSDNALASLAKMNQPTVTRILNAESADPRRSNVEKLAQVFGHTADELYDMAHSRRIVTYLDASFTDWAVPGKARMIVSAKQANALDARPADAAQPNQPSSPTSDVQTVLLAKLLARDIPDPIFRAILALLDTCPEKKTPVPAGV